MRQEDDSVDLNNSPDLLRLAEEVHASGKPRALRRNGEVLAVLLPFPSRERKRGRLTRRELSTQDVDAFHAAAGSWSGMDLAAFLAGVYAARDVADERPPVDL